MDRRKALLIYNPTAGNLRDADLCIGAIVHNLCKEENYSVTVCTTSADMTDKQCAALIADKYDLIVAAGGDGTIRLVLGAVSEVAPHTVVAIVPLGTGNQLARNLNIYQETLLSDPLLDAIDIMSNGTPTPIDLGIMNGAYFCVAAGAGPLSDAIVTPSRQDKANLKMLAYVGSIIQNFAAPPVIFQVHTGEDNFQVSASAIFVTNVADLGVGILSDNAELNDGLLDLCIMNPTEFTDYLHLGFRFVGKLVGGEAPYYIRKVTSVDIDVVPVESRLSDLQAIAHKVRTVLKGGADEAPRYKQVPAMIDGDAFGTTPMNIQVKPNAVRVLTKKA